MESVFAVIGSESVLRGSCKRSVSWPRTRRVPVVRIPGGGRLDDVVIEREITISVNDDPPISLYASPAHLDELATGHLYARGLISLGQDITELTVNGLQVMVELGVDSGGIVPDYGQITATSRDLSHWMKLLIAGAKLHKRTGGTHCAGIVSGGRIVIAREDVGRHNAIDKAVGAALIAGLAGTEVILLSTGRVNRETAAKAAAFNVPIMASRSAPTDAGLHLLKEVGITLVSFIRDNRVNVYTHRWRITDQISQEG